MDFIAIIKENIVNNKHFFLNMFFVFGFIRTIIGKQIELSDRISKIEGTCQEREKTIYKKEEANQDKNEDTGSDN